MTSSNINNHPSPLIIYDGFCHLCNRSVNFILKHDNKKIFRFTPFHSSFAIKMLTENIEMPKGNTVILLLDGKTYTRSDAALKTMMLLKRKWKLFYPLYLIPKFIRNGIYNIIAHNRYNWFGKQNTCINPPFEFKDRFIL